MKLFRYSGNKSKFPRIDLPSWAVRLVEPFCGSCGFSLQYKLPVLAMDANGELIAMLQWLQSRPPLETLRQYEGQRVDVRKLPVCDQAKTYLRINAASVCVGQLSSWTLYPQHTLPIGQTQEAIGVIQGWTFLRTDYRAYPGFPGDVVFIDPPYLGTFGNYGKNELDMEVFLAWLRNLQAPFILTYKEPILAIAPASAWTCWLRKKVPDMRNGGSHLREDWYYSSILPYEGAQR